MSAISAGAECGGVGGAADVWGRWVGPDVHGGRGWASAAVQESHGDRPRAQPSLGAGTAKGQDSLSSSRPLQCVVHTFRINIFGICCLLGFLVLGSKPRSQLNLTVLSAVLCMPCVEALDSDKSIFIQKKRWRSHHWPGQDLNLVISPFYCLVSV